MKRSSAALALSVSMLVGAAAYGHAAGKPVAKKNVPATNKATMGTTQLKGDQAVPGTTYTLGKTNPINFTLDSVEYRVDQVLIGDAIYFPQGNEKLMVLHYTLHNPQKREYRAIWNSLRFVAVDANDANWEYSQYVGVEETGAKMSMLLKPAQKTRGYALIKVPAGGEIPKLIVQGSDKLVLRYDLRGKVKPLPAPFADPSDPTGATAPAQTPVKFEDPCPIGNFDLRIDKAEFKDGPIGVYKAKKGGRFLVVTYTAKNKHAVKSNLRWNTFDAELKDGDGVPLPRVQAILGATRDESIPSLAVDPGQEFTFRHIFNVPSDAPLKTLSIGQNHTTARVFVYDVSGIR